MELFRIGDVDYTNRIVMPTYKVSSFPIYTEWTDSNYTKHRFKHVRKLKGSFTLKFQNASEYIAFNNHINRVRNKDESIECILYDNKYNSIDRHFVYIDYDPENFLPYMEGNRDYDGFEVTIEER